ncbi:amidohydrolase family protein [Polaribacter sp.]|uniref:amidohydrolase family protein n=1 Tax=Polaribacter sp. TaxID=1920175 RepID=UPI0025E3AEE5|nr:amidohydrolase family protein [Polaribacter sp.]
MIIDSHQHFWKYNPVRDAWIDESMEVIRRDFLPKDLKPILNNNGVDGCIAIQADQSEHETDFLLNCAKENPFIKGVVGWVDLRADNVEERLAYYSQNKQLKGIRHIVQAENNDFVLQADFQNGISKLEQFGLTYDLLVFPPQLEASIELVKAFPNQKFVLDHIAKPYIKDQKIEHWKTEITALAKAPNVFCKLSGMVTEADIKHWQPSDFKPYLDVVFKAFGTDRVMYGSDWPVCLLGASYSQVLKIVTDYISEFSDTEKAKILGGNALNFYNF